MSNRCTHFDEYPESGIVYSGLIRDHWQIGWLFGSATSLALIVGNGYAYVFLPHLDDVINDLTDAEIKVIGINGHGSRSGIDGAGKPYNLSPADNRPQASTIVESTGGSLLHNVMNRSTSDVLALLSSFVDSNISSILSEPTYAPDGTLYVGSMDNFLYAINGETGALLWKFETGADVLASPGISRDGTVYVTSYDKRIYAVEQQQEICDGALKHKATSIQRQGVGRNGYVYFGSGDKKVYELDGDTGELMWSHETGGPVNSSPAIGPNGTVILDHRQ